MQEDKQCWEARREQVLGKGPTLGWWRCVSQCTATDAVCLSQGGRAQRKVGVFIEGKVWLTENHGCANQAGQNNAQAKSRYFKWSPSTRLAYTWGPLEASGISCGYACALFCPKCYLPSPRDLHCKNQGQGDNFMEIILYLGIQIWRGGEAPQDFIFLKICTEIGYNLISFRI